MPSIRQPFIAGAAVAIAVLIGGGAVFAQSSPDLPADPSAPDAIQSVQPVSSEAAASTQATFLSASAEAWDVTVDGVAVCSTPCTLPLSSIQFVGFRSQEFNPVLLDVGRLPAGELMVTGKPLQHGMYAGGIVATTLGGMALATGITLTAVGLAKGRDGMTTAGLISGGVGAVSVAGGIYLMLAAVPTVRVDRAGPRAAVSGLLGIGARF